jgi:nucleoside-diphosphate-sugar epimerase
LLDHLVGAREGGPHLTFGLSGKPETCQHSPEFASHLGNSSAKKSHHDRISIIRQPITQPSVKAANDAPFDVLRIRLPSGSKVLVTGATGFVGGRLVERLLQEHDASVRCIVRNVGRAARVGRLPVELVPADLKNTGEINRAVNGVDYVFHCAYDWRSRRQNIDGLRNLVDACAAHSVKRLVHVSTFAVYEPFPDGPLTEETRDGDRSNGYVRAKLDLEEIIFEAVHKRGVAATVVQPSIVYGPFSVSWTNAPAEMLIFGDVILPDRGEGLCNAVYIDDLVDGLILAALAPEAVGERFILSGPKPVTWATFFTEMSVALGTKPPKFWPRELIAKSTEVSYPKRLIKIVVGPARKILKAGLDAMPGPLRKTLSYYLRSGGPRKGGEIFLPSRGTLALYSSKAIADSEKARSKLGYRPQYDFQRGMELTGRYLQQAYGDVLRSTAIGRNPTENTPAKS